MPNAVGESIKTADLAAGVHGKRAGRGPAPLLERFGGAAVREHESMEVSFLADVIPDDLPVGTDRVCHRPARRPRSDDLGDLSPAEQEAVEPSGRSYRPTTSPAGLIPSTYVVTAPAISNDFAMPPLTTRPCRLPLLSKYAPAIRPLGVSPSSRVPAEPFTSRLYTV